MKKLWLRTGPGLLAALMLAACTAPTGQNPPQGGDLSTESLYYLYLGGQNYTFNAQGELLSGDEETYNLLTDLASGEGKYRLYTRQEDTGEDDEWGNPIIQQYSRLCDLEGNVIQDWETMDYSRGIGGLVIRREHRGIYEPILPGQEYETSLWDPAAKEAVVEGVDSLQVLNEDEGLFLALDASGKALGVLDSQANIVSGFPAPEDYYYPFCEDGFMTADRQNPYGEYNQKERTVYLLDKDFQILLEGYRLNSSYTGLRGPYIQRTWEDERGEILSLEDFSTLLTWNGVGWDGTETALRYFDGELAIFRTGERGEWQFSLQTVSGEELSEEPFDQLTPEDDFSVNADGPAAGFIGVRGETIYRLDREGSILYETQIPGLESVSPQGDGYTVFYLYGEDPTDGSTFPAGLLGPDLSVIIPADTYTSIYRLSEWDGSISTDLSYFFCSKTVNKSYRMDILSSDGQIIWDNLTSTGSITDGKLAVARGFSMGLVDLEGNWISRYSIYNNLGND